MNRKEFANRLILGGGTLALLPSMVLLQSCQYEPLVRTTLSKTDIPFLDELAEAILPETKETPGAKTAEVGAYILLMYQDCMDPEYQPLFVSGINEIDARSVQLFSDSFIEIDPSQKLELLESIHEEAIAYHKEVEGTDPHYFDLLKGLVISGYFTSETGMTLARNYLPVPGKYEGCISYKDGDKPWSL